MRPIMERLRRSPEPIIRMVAHSQNHARLLTDLHARALAASGASRSVLLELDAPHRVLRPTSVNGTGQVPPEPWVELPDSLTLAYEVLASGHPRQVAPLAPVMPDLAFRLSSPTAILAPVVSNGHALGLLALAVSVVVPALEWIDDVAACADGFAIALARARLERDMARRREVDTLVAEWSRTSSGDGALQAMEWLCTSLTRVFAAERVTLWHHDRVARRVTVTAASDGSHHRRPASSPTADADAMLVRALRSAAVTLVPVATASGRTPLTNAAVPLRGQRRALGVLVLQGMQVPPGDSVSVNESLTHLARAVAHTIDGRQLLEDVLGARRELAQSQALSHLAAGIAHELNNPLQAVLGHLELARRVRPLPGPLAITLGQVHREAERAAQVVRNLLVLAGSGRLRLRPVSATRALTGALGLRAAGCRKQGITVNRDLPAGLPAVMGDAVLLRQAFLNILTNAEQALAGHADGRIDVEARLVDGSVIVVVRDNGPGLAADVSARVFDPFFTTRDTGSGLGLALTRRVVQEFGGDVSAGNHPDGGAMFTVSLPVAMVVK
jgi:signal transduction histidine kinase